MGKRYCGFVGGFRGSRERRGGERYVPICVQTSSVRLPMNCGVALTPRLMVSESTILPMLNQRVDLRRWREWSGDG